MIIAERPLCGKGGFSQPAVLIMENVLMQEE
jgi:hypothetical protein